MKRSLRQDGFSLVEVMIGFALMCVLALGISSMISQFGKTQSQTGAKLSNIGLVQDVRMQLMMTATCSKSITMGPIRGDTVSLPVKVTMGKIEVFDNSKPPAYGGVEISQIHFENLKEEASLPESQRLFSANLMMSGKAPDGFSFKPVSAVRVFFVVSPSGEFVRCASADNASICADLGGTYKAGGSPVCKLNDSPKNNDQGNGFVPLSPGFGDLHSSFSTAPTKRNCVATQVVSQRGATTGSSNCCQVGETSSCSLSEHYTEPSQNGEGGSVVRKTYTCECRR